MTTTDQHDDLIRRRPTVHRLLNALQHTQDDAHDRWAQIRDLPEPDLPTIEWARIITSAKTSSLSLRNTPVAAFDQAVVVFDQLRCSVILRLSVNRFITPPSAATPAEELRRRRHDNIAAAVKVALRHPAAWGPSLIPKPIPT